MWTGEFLIPEKKSCRLKKKINIFPGTCGHGLNFCESSSQLHGGTVVQWLGKPRRHGFNAKAMHSFLVLFHLKKVARLRTLLEEEGGHKIYVGIRCPN